MKHFKSIFVAILFVLASINAKSQYFDGIYVGGSLETLISKYKAKGYIFDKYHEWGAMMQGKVGDKPIELFIFVTPKTKVVCKVTIYLPKKSTWWSIKDDYETNLDMFKSKYGTPDYSFTDFLNPYYEGDGYEMSALELEKVNYAAYWFDKSNANVSVEISKFKQICVTYENVANMKIRKREQEEINSRAF